MLVKLDGEPPATPEAARRYSPTECVGARKEKITGNPDPKHIRLANAFSKSLENHAHMVALYAL
jgi:hypothetical protein